MRARGTLILLALCLVVGGYLWFVERGKPTGEEQEAADRQVLAIPPAQASSFQLDYGDSAVALTRSGGRWQVILADSTGKPGPPLPADEAAVEQLSGFFASLSADRLLPAAEIDSAASGLDHPWVRVTVETAGDSATGSHLLAFGYQNPTRTAYYARVDDRKNVALLPASAIDGAFRRPLSDFRDRHLARFDPDRAATIDLAFPERTLILGLDEDGRWLIGRPPLRADEAQVRGLLTRLRDLQALELGRDAASMPRFPAPALRVAVYGATRDSLLAELTIGPEQMTGGEALHLVRSRAQPVVGSIRAEDFAGLALTPDDLRDRHLVDLHGAAIDSLTIVAGGRLVRGAASDSAFADVMAGLPEWRWSSLVSDSALGPALAAYGLAPPRASLWVHLRNGGGGRGMELGNPEPSGGVFARRLGEPGVMVAPEAVLETIEQAMAKAEAASGKNAPPPPGSR